MNFETAVFYFLAAILLFASVRVITAKNPVHAAMFLVLAFFSAAGVWLLLEAEFLAITLVLVYVGAVMVLFLFVVMMLDINIEQMHKGFWSNLPLAATVAIVMVFEMVAVFSTSNVNIDKLVAPQAHAAGYSNTKELGRLLYTDYVYPFEIAAVILLVAIVAAIALTMRKRKDTKYQNPGEQVKVRRQDRVRVIPMRTSRRVDVPAPASDAED
jgi:NADH-quinone oxidoreductase subunit J